MRGPPSIEPRPMTAAAGANTTRRHEGVVCPFCPLGCDDLSVRADSGAVRLRGPACEVADHALRRADARAVPRVDGEPVALATAVAAAAKLLASASAPHVGGLAGDLAAMRAALRLARRLGASVDHADGDALTEQQRVLQDCGQLTTTYTELRNRADLVLFAGVDPAALPPRFVERCLPPPASAMWLRRPRRIAAIGPARHGRALARVLPEADTWVVPGERIGEAARWLSAHIAGHPVGERPRGLRGDPGRLLERLASARYPVVLWRAADLMPHAALAIEALLELVRTLNRSGRAAGLPLGGGDGGATAVAASAWLAGFPPRLRFVDGEAEYDPIAFATDRVLAAGPADALLWLATLDPATAPPPGSIPRVVIGHPALAARSAEVYIPAGIPGIDHAGQLIRGDGIVALPLAALRSPAHPPAHEVLAAIEAALP